MGTTSDDVIDTGGGTDIVDAGWGNDIVRISNPILAGNPFLRPIDGGPGHDILDLTGWHGHLFDVEHGDFLSLEQWDTGQSHPTGIADVSNFEEVHLGTGVDSFSVDDGSMANPLTVQPWTIIGSEGADNIIGGRGYDNIQTGDGNDIVAFIGGGDRVSLGNGDDQFTIVVDTGYHDHVQLDGGPGSDTLDVDQSTFGQHTTVDLEAGTAQFGTTSLAMADIENFGVQVSSVARQPDWTLTVAGTEGANHLVAGGGGDAVLLGRGGDDLIEAGPLTGTLTAYGGSGNDSIFGNNAGDWINGGGHYPADSIPAADTTDGADHLQGGSGNDHIYGNSQFAAQGSVDGGDLIHGEAGGDYINGNGGDDSIYGDDGSDRLYGGAGNDMIDGGNGNDHLNGNKGDDTLLGDDGNDEMLGGQGNDRLYGGTGDDQLSGGLGDDQINGGDGIDTVTGGDGNDVFLLYGSAFTLSGANAGQTDIITDFQDGHDTFSMPSAITVLFHPGSAVDVAAAAALAQSVFSPNGGGDAAAVQVGADTYLFFGNSGHGPDQAVCLTNVDATTIDGRDFV